MDFGKGLARWKTIPTRRRRSVTSIWLPTTSRSSTKRLPLARAPGTTSFMRLIVRRKVVLPEPEGPIKRGHLARPNVEVDAVERLLRAIEKVEVAALQLDRRSGVGLIDGSQPGHRLSRCAALAMFAAAWYLPFVFIFVIDVICVPYEFVLLIGPSAFTTSCQP